MNILLLHRYKNISITGIHWIAFLPGMDLSYWIRSGRDTRLLCFPLTRSSIMMTASRHKSFEAAIHTLKKSAWPADINKAQAGFLNLDFITIGNNEKIKDLACFPDTYRKQLLFGTLFFNAIAATRIGETDQYNSLVNHRLDSVLKKDPDGYKLIWAHFLIPHIPYARNKEGKLLKDYGEAYDKPTAKRHYIDYLAYGNTLVESLLREHPVLQNKIVIISGDHGARFSFVEKKDWNRPYCAVRFPSAFDTSSLQKINYISQLPAFLAGYAEATVFTR
jgi:hypothetical protein